MTRFVAKSLLVAEQCDVNIHSLGNEQANNFAKDARNSPQLSNSLTDAIPRRKLTSHPVKKHFIPDLKCNRVTSTPPLSRLRR
ncbi:hypothetical protein TNCV_223341 [Trichonephila clavipes]|nr:hypothetical protein TNCV_223341 [Trichonephila clavipes]